MSKAIRCRRMIVCRHSAAEAIALARQASRMIQMMPRKISGRFWPSADPIAVTKVDTGGHCRITSLDCGTCHPNDYNSSRKCQPGLLYQEVNKP